MELINIHKDVKELLDELNSIGRSMIFGGYLRDCFTCNIPNDVDIVTNIPIDILEEKYASYEKAKRRKTNSGFDVFSFKMHKTEKIFVEIISTNMNLLEKASQADYTINSLLYDGSNLIDLENGVKDIKEGLVKEVDIEIIKRDLKVRPYLWLKTLRLVSMTGYDLSEKTFKALNNEKSCIKEISDEIMQTEGHKTMNGKDPFKAMKLLSKMGFISPFNVNIIIGDVAVQPQQKLCLLAVLSNKQVVDDFVEFYRFQQTLIEKYENLYEMYNSDEKLPSRFRNQIITIKKIVREKGVQAR